MVIVKNEHLVKGELLSIDLLEIVCILLFDHILQAVNGLIICECHLQHIWRGIVIRKEEQEICSWQILHMMLTFRISTLLTLLKLGQALLSLYKHLFTSLYFLLYPTIDSSFAPYYLDYSFIMVSSSYLKLRCILIICSFFWIHN